MSEYIIESINLKKYFPLNKGLFDKARNYIKAVDSVNLKIERGKTLGLVGESGCGKSTLARILLLLLEPTDGKVIFEGTEITNSSNLNLKSLRKKIQIIFQDPYSSLNPKYTVGNMLKEIIRYHNIAKGEEINKKMKEILEKVGLKYSDSQKYPHEFSGGQRQRVCIARALSFEPEFIICDEPVSALDVSVQAQIINLLIDLQNELHLTYLFISHDLSIVKHISDEICIMYLGKVVEHSKTEDIFNNPKHPYTEALLASVPENKSDTNKLINDIPSSKKSIEGCSFKPRCIKAFEDCGNSIPELVSFNNHSVRCFLYN